MQKLDVGRVLLLLTNDASPSEHKLFFTGAESNTLRRFEQLLNDDLL